MGFGETGIALMLKSLGIDPDEILNMTKGIGELAQSADARLAKVETDVSEILETLRRMESKNGEGKNGCNES